jgi:uncharacterized protein YbbK (DUF523 family)
MRTSQTPRDNRPERVLVSACLLGSPVRYNGSARLAHHPVLDRWQEEGRVVPLCPEVAAGFPTPRPAAELEGSSDGAAIFEGRARVVEDGGADVSELYRVAAAIALEEAQRNGCRFALLTDGSPSCGSSFVHDGSFTGRRVAGRGSTTAMLEKHGIRVFAETEIDALDAILRGNAIPGAAA